MKFKSRLLSFFIWALYGYLLSKTIFSLNPPGTWGSFYKDNLLTYSMIVGAAITSVFLPVKTKREYFKSFLRGLFFAGVFMIVSSLFYGLFTGDLGNIVLGGIFYWSISVYVFLSCGILAFLLGIVFKNIVEVPND